MGKHASNQLGLGMATMMVAGSMIGSGIYLLPVTLAAIGSISIYGWLIAALGGLALAGVFSLIFVMHPSDDGISGIVGDGLGKFWGIQGSFLYWFALPVGNVPLAVAITGYLTVFMPFLDSPLATLASNLVVVWLLAGIAIMGPRAIGRTHGVTLAAGLIPLLAAGVLGWLWFDPQIFAESWNVSGGSDLDAVYGSLLTVFWAFLGVESVSMVARMVKNPARNVPLATMGGVTIAALVYMTAVSAIFGLVPTAELAASNAPFAIAVEKVLGPAATMVVAGCVILKVSGTLGGWMLVSGETTRWTAAGGVLPRWLCTVRKDGTPVRAILFVTMLMSLVVILTISPTIGEQFAILVEATVTVMLVVFAMAALALLNYARNSSPGRKSLAWIASLGTIVFAAFVLATSGKTLLILTVVLMMLALPLYLAFGRKRAQ